MSAFLHSAISTTVLLTKFAFSIAALLWAMTRIVRAWQAMHLTDILHAVSTVLSRLCADYLRPPGKHPRLRFIGHLLSAVVWYAGATYLLVLLAATFLLAILATNLSPLVMAKMLALIAAITIAILAVVTQAEKDRLRMHELRLR